MPTKELLHVTEAYQRSHDRRLIRVEAYYKNNTNNGIGVILDGNDLSLFDEMIRDYEDAWNNADEQRREEFIEIYIRQLEIWGAIAVAQRSNQDKYLSAVNIAFLEKYGYIQGDKYNGCQFTYDVNPDSLDKCLNDVANSTEP